MTNAATQFDVFLSHNSADKPAVEALAQRLLTAGFKPWLDSWNLVPGDPWQEGLEEALDTCDACAVFLGPSGIGPWHNEELRVALDRHARDRTRSFRVIPILLPEANPADPNTLPRFLARMTWVDFRRGLDDAEAFRRLLAGVRGVAPGPSAACSPDTQRVRRAVTILMEGDFEKFSASEREALVFALSRLLRVTASQISILRAEPGSIIVTLELPEEAAQQLLHMLATSDPMIQSLGIRAVKSSSVLIPGQRQRLEAELARLLTQYETWTRRIAALDIDIGRTLNSLEKQVLEERRGEVVAEREKVADQMEEIEAKLSTG